MKNRLFMIKKKNKDSLKRIRRQVRKDIKVYESKQESAVSGSHVIIS